MTADPTSPRRHPLLTPAIGAAALWLLAAPLLPGCVSHHQRMVDRVEWLVGSYQHRQALDYLERYLQRHPDNLDGWKYKVSIRLDLDQRAAAAAEYWRLSEALGQPHPEVLAHVVLGDGGDWTVSDYAPLARCSADAIADPAFFAAVLDGYTASESSPVFLAPRRETVIGVMDAMPGRFGATASPIVQTGLADAAPEVRVAAARAAVRLTRVDPEVGWPLALEALQDSTARVRRAALEAILAPTGPEDLTRLPGATPGEADPAVLVAWLGVAARLDPEPGGALRRSLRGAAPLADALAEPPAPDPEAVDAPSPDEPATALVDTADPLLRLAADVGSGRCDAACWNAAGFPERRALMTLMAPVLPLQSALIQAASADPDVFVRTELARYLENGAADPALLALLDDPEHGVRMAAARSLTRSADPAALAPLEAHAAASGMEEKLSLLHAMLTLEPNPYLPLVEQLMVDDAALVREAAIGPLASACGEEVPARMRDALTDEDPHVVVRAAAALYLYIGGPPPAVEQAGSPGEGEGEGVEEETGEGEPGAS